MTSTFDKVTKDQEAKFVDILSAIGGTMGLLTGFSIVSALQWSGDSLLCCQNNQTILENSKLIWTNAWKKSL